MIGALVTLISLNLTLTLVNAGQVAGALPVTGANLTTPVQLVSPSHGVPPARVVHAVVSGVVGTVEANGLWVLTPVDANTFALTSLDGQGNLVQPAGTHAYVSGGTISFAFPDWGILLGRQLYALSSAVASPRIAFIPTTGAAWGLEPYGGLSSPAPPRTRGSAETQTQNLAPQCGTRFPTFDVYVTAAANPPQPNYGDFDAVETLTAALYVEMFRAVGAPRCRVLGEDWPSQTKDAGSNTQRGQQLHFRVQFQEPMAAAPLSFVPSGTGIAIVVEPVDPLVPDDQTTVTVAPA